MISLENKVALVTGGSKGIGAAICALFAAAGADVAFTYMKSRSHANSVAHEIASFGRHAISIKADVSKIADIKRAIRVTKETFGRIDILVNNAGIWKEGRIGQMTERQWDEMMDVNLKSVFLATNEIVPLMKKQRSGKIVNIGSTAGQRGEPFHSHYAASKSGLLGFTKSVGAELASHGIQVNCVAPGWVDTDMSADPLRIPRKLKEIVKLIPNGRVASPEDVAKVSLFLASDLSNHLIGSTISVNGGSVMV